MACCVGFVIGNLVMAVIFYGLVTSTGLIRRLVGRRSIRKAPDPGLGSYWMSVQSVVDKKRYYNQF
jgi:hypothetical protein